MSSGRDAGLDRFGIGGCAANDGAQIAIDGEDLIGGGGRGVGAARISRKIERVGKRAGLDTCDDLVGMGVENEDEASGGADAPNFVAFCMFAHVGDAGCDEKFSGWGGARRDRRR